MGSQDALSDQLGTPAWHGCFVRHATSQGQHHTQPRHIPSDDLAPRRFVHLAASLLNTHGAAISGIKI
jgi:hypothetical protein